MSSSSSFLQSTGSAAAGAGFKSLFEHFLGAIRNASKENSIFNSSFQRLEETLQCLAPAIKTIDSYNKGFDWAKEIDGLKDILKKGADLVTKCSKISRYDIVRKPIYTKKLLKLEDSLSRYTGSVLQLHHFANQKENLFQVKSLDNQIDSYSMGAPASYGYPGESFGAVGGGFLPPKLKVVPVGLEIPLRELKKKMVTDGVPFLVLSAPGGCGKTTLATAFCHDPEVQARYKNNIIYITVSKAANLLTIAQNIFQRLGRRAPGFQSEADAVSDLEWLLKVMDGEAKLLVLDDVWSGAELLLERLYFKMPNYQILVTSRDEFKSLGSTYKLMTLNDADAMNLFRQSAFPQDGNSYEPDQEVLEKIVKSCEGFPLLISVVGKSLLRKPAVEWCKRAEECSKNASLFTASFSGNSEVLICLQKSVDALDDKQSMKECYMDLGLFPKDRRIPATALIDVWVELHGLDEDDAISNLYELSFRSLVDLVVIRKDTSEDDGFHNVDFVTQHGLLRDLVIFQSHSATVQLRERLFVEIAGNTFPKWWTGSTEKIFKAKLLAITTDENFSSSWPDIHAPEVEVLVLNFKTQSYALPKFIERMENLKVVIVTNHGPCRADLSDIHHLASLPNLRRIRLEKTLIPPDFLPSIASGTLEKLSLFMCSVGQAFSNVVLQPNSFSNLEVIDIDYCSDLMELPVWVFDLLQLKKLSITNCYELSVMPEELGNLVNLEILRLTSCIELSKLPESIGNLQELKILDISDCLSIQKLPEQVGELCNLRKLYMVESDRCEIPLSVAQLSNLKEVVGDRETANSWEMFKPYIPDLKITKLVLDLGFLAWTDSSMPTNSEGSLGIGSRLHLEDGMSSIPGGGMTQSLQSQVVSCFQLQEDKTKVSDRMLDLAESIPMEVKEYAPSFEFKPSHCTSMMDTQEQLYISKSPSLKSCSAHNFVSLFFSYCKLPQLWKGGEQLLVSLKRLDAKHSDLLWIPDLSKAQKLESLNLEGCANLVGISCIQYLTKLQHLNLKGCQSLKGIPSLIRLKSLKTFDLSDCSNLTRLPPSLGCLPNLSELNLKNCAKLANLPRSVMLLMKSLETLNISGCSSMWKSIGDDEDGTVPLSTKPHLGFSDMPSSEATHEENVPNSNNDIPDEQVEVVAEGSPSEDLSLDLKDIWGKKAIEMEEEAFTGTPLISSLLSELRTALLFPPKWGSSHASTSSSHDINIQTINHTENNESEVEESETAALFQMEDQQQPLCNDDDHNDAKTDEKKPLSAAAEPIFCQVEHCQVDLTGAETYHQQHKICEAHSMATAAFLGNILQLFCQQCCRFHALGDFDEEERICRSQLAGLHQKQMRQSSASTTGTEEEHSSSETEFDAVINISEPEEDNEKRLLQKRIKTIEAPEQNQPTQAVEQQSSPSFNDWDEANAIGDIEDHILEMIEHISHLNYTGDDEKAAAAAPESVLAWLAEMEQSVPDTVWRMKSAKAKADVASEKWKVADASLVLGELRLRLLDMELSSISEEEEEIEAELQRLMDKKREMSQQH